ncbi:MAG: hypothetical protein AAGA90_09900 [Actinomycetota bacterium]
MSTPRRGPNRLAIIVAAFAVVAAACSGGDEVADPPPVFTPAGDASESLADPGTTLLPPTPSDPPEIEGPSLADFAVPCGVDPEPTPATGPGIDDTTIRIATGNDEGGRHAGRSGASMPEAVVAMAEHCNTLGGLAGRAIAVETYDAAVTEVPDVAARQCEETFALVGHGYLQASLGTETWNGCGLPRFDGWSSALLRAEPVPLLAHRVAAVTDGAALSVAIVMPETTAGRTEAEAAQIALVAAGFSVATVEFYSPAVEIDWPAMQSRIAASGAGSIHVSGSCRGATMPLAAAGGAEGPTIIADASSYDDDCRADAAALGVPLDNILLQVPFLPVEDGDDAPVTQAFVEILERFGASATGDALLAGAAFWEFAVAVDACRSDVVTRDCLDERRDVEWNGAGIHPPAADASCRVVVAMTADGFERVLPAEAGRFGCPDEG